MRSHFLVPLGLLLSACGDADSVTWVLLDEACGTDAYGYDTPGEDAIAALERTNCYRNLMGLQAASLDARLDQAAQAHADYMQAAGTISHQEVQGSEGFTGEWAWDRAETAGYSCNGCSIGEVVAFGVGAAESVDLWVNSVYHRVPFTGHGWMAGGFGRDGLYTSMTIVSPFPESVDKAVIYPVNGQLEVPTSFDSDTEWPDPAPQHGLVGYPVTVTVSSTTYANLNGSNPFGIQLEDASFVGPDGQEVDHLVLEPDNDQSLHYTLSLLPVHPLEAGATYEVDVRVSWAGDQERSVSSVFTTVELD
jgi:hypothetical protein